MKYNKPTAFELKIEREITEAGIEAQARAEEKARWDALAEKRKSPLHALGCIVFALLAQV